MIDLDAAATIPIRWETLQAMWSLLAEECGNPSNTHNTGRAAARSPDQRMLALITTCAHSGPGIRIPRRLHLA